MSEAPVSGRGPAEPPLVLVVDDEPDLLELVSLTLSRMNLKTRTAPDLASARRLLKAERVDLCLTDMRLPDGDGLDLVAWIQENRASVPVAVITAHGNVESAVRALKLGAFDFVSKPLDLGVLRKLVGSALKLGAAGDADSAATACSRVSWEDGSDAEAATDQEEPFQCSTSTWNSSPVLRWKPTAHALLLATAATPSISL